MANADTRSLQQIRRDTEQTRAGLTTTVEQLKTSVAETANDIRQRISPDAIKAEVSGYIRSRGEQLVNDVTSAARRNPMQSVAVAATVAYPLLKVARGIPFPVLMVGAGLFLAGSKTGQAATQKAADMAADFSDEVGRRAQDFGDRAKDAALSVQNYASDRYDRLAATVTDGSNQINEAANVAGESVMAGAETIKNNAESTVTSLADRATALKAEGLRAAGSAAATVQDIASGAAEAARSAANLVAEKGVDAATSARATASDASDRIGKTFAQTIDQSPMLVAGLGLLIGGLIASALPRSDFEDSLVGETSSSAKRKAEDLASQALGTATTTISEIYDQASQQAEEEGLTTQGVAKAAQDIRQRVQRVAEAAVSTAFEPSKANQPTHGENDHG